MAVAQQILGRSRQPDQEQFLVMMLKILPAPDLAGPAVQVALGALITGMALLWFRRSRKNGPKPQAEPEAQPEAGQEGGPRQARAPLRIRGLLLLNLGPTDGTGQIETAPPLGRRDEVIRSLQGAGMQFDDDGRGEVTGVDHRIAIDIGRDDPVPAAVAAAEGDAGIELLRTLLESQRWRAYAPRAGVFIEPDALDLFALPDTAPPR